MEAPVYHLSGVVHSRNETEDFNGPLDLILSLLSKNKMEIQEIQLAVILDQYLDWMHRRRELDLEVASEFVMMASHLLYIKTRMLLSIHDEEAQGEMDELIASLEERCRSECYAGIREVVEPLRRRYEQGRDYGTRPPEPFRRENTYRYEHRPEDLLVAMGRVLERGEEALPPPVRAFEGIVGREPYPVADKAKEILTGLIRFGVTRFRALFSHSHSRSEVVATFLAVLELCRGRKIRLAGTDVDCTVTCTEPEDDAQREEMLEEVENAGN